MLSLKALDTICTVMYQGRDVLPFFQELSRSGSLTMCDPVAYFFAPSATVFLSISIS